MVAPRASERPQTPALCPDDKGAALGEREREKTPCRRAIEPVEAPHVLAFDFQPRALRLLGDLGGAASRAPRDDDLADRVRVAAELLENRVHAREPVAGVRFLPTHSEVTLARRWGESSTA